jgi:serine/threonine-protein kinase SRPK3
MIADLQESNILLQMNETTAEQDLDKFEQQELNSPCPRKIDGDRVIYASRRLVPPIYRYGPPVICDFGEARFEEYDNMYDIQPYQYRAPEVIFNIPWDEKVDIWSLGVMVRTNVVWMRINADEERVALGPAWERKFVPHHWRTRG